MSLGALEGATAQPAYGSFDLTLATYSSDSGDSGGIVYTYVSSTSTRYTVGIHRCSIRIDEHFI